MDALVQQRTMMHNDSDRPTSFIYAHKPNWIPRCTHRIFRKRLHTYVCVPISHWTCERLRYLEHHHLKGVGNDQNAISNYLIFLRIHFEKLNVSKTIFNRAKLIQPVRKRLEILWNIHMILLTPSPSTLLQAPHTDNERTNSKLTHQSKNPQAALTVKATSEWVLLSKQKTCCCWTWPSRSRPTGNSMPYARSCRAAIPSLANAETHQWTVPGHCNQTMPTK